MKADSISVADVVSTVGPDSKRTALVVLGMHRSGTSALARVLSMMGCDLPNTLIGANESNETGHWESERVRNLNNEILSSAGSDWLDWTEFNPDWYTSPKSEEYKRKLISTVESEFDDRGLMILKDPRICKILPIWSASLRAMDIRPAYIFFVRHPFEVAGSLKHRNNLSIAQGLLIWLRYVLEAEYASRGEERTILGYNQMLSDWGKCVKQISVDLEVSFPIRIEKASSQVGQFLNQGLRHHKSDQANLHQSFQTQSWISQAWSVFESWLQNGEQSGDYEKLDSIRVSLNQCQPVFEQVVAIAQRDYSTGHKLELLQKTQNETAEQLVAARIANQDLEETIKTNDRIHAEIESTLRAVNESKQRELADLGSEKKAVLADLQSTKASNESKEREIAMLRDQSDSQRVELENVLRSLAILDNEKQVILADLRSVKIDSRARINAAEQEIEQTANASETRVNELVSERQELQKKNRGLQESIAKKDQRITDLVGRLDDGKARINRLTRLATDRNEMLSEKDQAVKSLLRKVSKLEKVDSELSELVGILLKTFLANKNLPIVHNRRVRNYARFVESTQVFDKDWYMSTYPDVATSGLEAAEHFVKYGANEGRAPSARFAKSN